MVNPFRALFGGGRRRPAAIPPDAATDMITQPRAAPVDTPAAAAPPPDAARSPEPIPEAVEEPAPEPIQAAPPEPATAVEPAPPPPETPRPAELGTRAAGRSTPTQAAREAKMTPAEIENLIQDVSEIGEDGVGPILRSGEIADAVIDAIAEDNAPKQVFVLDRGDYVRINTLGECRLSRATLERHLGREYSLTKLEIEMPSFAGLIKTSDAEYTWYFSA